MEIIIEVANLVQLWQLAAKLTEHKVAFREINNSAIKITTFDWALCKVENGVVLVAGADKKAHYVKLRYNEFLRVVLK